MEAAAAAEDEARISTGTEKLQREVFWGPELVGKGIWLLEPEEPFRLFDSWCAEGSGTS